MATHKIDGSERKPKLIVVGAGIGGLATAIATTLTGQYQVLVLEGASTIGEVGAGIQVAPNSSRLLRRWGCEKYLIDKVVLPLYGFVYRWKDGRKLSEALINPMYEENFGAPHWYVHRADLLDAFLLRLKELGGDVRVGARVTDVDVGTGISKRPSVTLASGETLSCDFIVGADGIRSRVRQFVAPGSAPRPTGDYAYRFTIPTSDMADDPHLAKLIKVPASHVWWGPGKHVVSYLLRGGKTFNVVAACPDDGSLKEETKGPGDIQQLKSLYDGWCPPISALVGKATPERLTKWRLMDLEPLSTWNNGKCVLIGDACHPMLPYLAQGGSQAIEDAGALAQLLQYLPNDLEKAAKLFTNIRYDRATQVQQTSRAQRKRFHMPDGPEQEIRDSEMMSGGTAIEAKAYAWKSFAVTEGKKIGWSEGLFGHDVEEAARRALVREGISLQ